MRIIGGEHRGRSLVPAPHEGVRPTADPVREALFNLLGQDLTGRSFVDLAAGTGAVGLEAYSRGARPVVLVEKDRRALHAIERNLARLDPAGRGLPGVAVVGEDVVRWLRHGNHAATGAFDLVFLDPPYGYPRLGLWLTLLADRQLLSSDGLVVVEHRSGEGPAWPNGWEPLWSRRYGDATLSSARVP